MQIPDGIRKTRRFLLNCVEAPVVVLLYHRVAELELDPFRLAVTPANFEEQLQVLSESYQVITPEDLFRFLSKKSRPPKKAVMITFDDGYQDNYTQAYPLLKKYQLPATFFIATATIGTKKAFWWDRLETMISQLPDQHISLLGHTVSLQKDNRAWATQYLRNILHKEPGVHAILDAFSRETGVAVTSAPADAPLLWEQLKQMHKDPLITIGAHTKDHIRLSELSEQDQFAQISSSIQQLEQELGSVIQHFSYPFGSKADFNAASVSVLKELGMHTAYMLSYGQVHSWSDPLRLSRIMVENWDGNTFARQLSRFRSF